MLNKIKLTYKMEIKIKKKWIILIILGIFILFSCINNTSIFVDKTQSYKSLAHIGIAQTFDISKVEWDANTAKTIYEPQYMYFLLLYSILINFK